MHLRQELTRYNLGKMVERIVGQEEKFKAELIRIKGYWYVQTELGMIELDDNTGSSLEFAYKTKNMK